MRKLLKKVVALTLALCSVLTLYTPASAAGYEFPEMGDTADLGETLRGDLNLPGQVEIVELEGRQFLAAPIKGGRFYMFCLTDYLAGKPNSKGNYIYDMAESGINVPRGIARDSSGNIYVAGDSPNVFWYNIHSGDSGKIKTGASGLQGICADESGNVYASGKNGNTSAVIYKIDAGTKKANLFYETVDLISAQCVVWGGGNVYIQGQVKGTQTSSEIRMLSADGRELATHFLPNTLASYYISYVDGVVFLGIAAISNANDGFIALDTAGGRFTPIHMGKSAPILGLVTEPKNGKSFVVVSEDGIYEYNVSSRTLGDRVSKSGKRSIRARNNVITYRGNEYLLSVGPSSAATTPAKVGGSSVKLDGLLDGAFSTYTSRCITPGVAGTGVAVYVGAYLSSAVSSYSPQALVAVNPKAISNGHSQTDSLIVYKGKVYAGVYSGGYLIEYDPATDKVRELIPGGLENAGYGQRRIHGLAAGDNKIFFATIPTDQQLGGCIGWYDLTTGSYYCQRNVIRDQAAITLAYDEARDILYGGTTIRGGTNTTPTAEQAVLFAYDVNEKKLLASAELDDLTGDKPRFISGIARDPNTGKFWGTVSQSVFSFAYEGGQLKVTKEWAATTTPDNPYPDGASKSWFPRPIVFDDYGRMYIGFNEAKYGIMQFALGSDGKIGKAVSVADSVSRVYTIGTDGNLYYYDGKLYMRTLSRVTMVRQLVDNTRPEDREGVVLARQAYESLTPEEKEQFGKTYYNKLLALEGDEDAIAQLAVDAVMDAIACIGTVTAASGPEIEAARRAYDALTAEQKKKVVNIQLLLDAEKAYHALTSQQQKPPVEKEDPDEEQSPDTQPVVPTEPLPDAQITFVITQIDAIGTVTADSGDAIRLARWAYDGLTPEQQTEVSNYQHLLAAEEAYKLLAPKEDPETIDLAVISVQTQINAIGAINAASVPMIRAARAAYDALTPEQQAKVANVQTLLDAEEVAKAFAPDAPTVEEKDNSAAVIIVVTVLILAAGGAAAVFFLKKKKNSPAEKEGDSSAADAASQ